MLTTLVLAAIIPILLFSACVAYLVADSSRETARRAAISTLASVANRVTTALNKEVAVAEALAALPSLDLPDLERFYRTAQRIAPNRHLWETVSLADPDGMQRMNILRRLGDQLGPVADRDSFDQALQSKQSAIGGIGPKGPVSGKQLVSISVPVIRNGKVSLILIVGLSAAEIQTILTNAGAPKNWRGVIVDADGDIIARSTGHDDVGRPASEVLRQAIATAKSGEYRRLSRSGVEVDTLYQTLAGTSGWSVHFGVPSATLNGPVSRSTALLVTSCIVCLVLAGGLAHLAARDLEQRRRDHEQYAALVLAMSEERAALAVEAVELGTWRLDIQANEISGSERTRCLLGLPPSAQNGAPMTWSVALLLSSVHPKDRGGLTRALDDCCRAGGSLDFEFRTLQQDRTYRWLRAAGRGFPLDGERTPGPERRGMIVQGVLADIDPARRAHAERVRLMKRLAAAQENEQRRIARELHDQVGQSLTGLALGLKALEQALNAVDSQVLRDQVLWLESLTSEISRDIHRAAVDLRPAALDDLGLPRALSALAAELTIRHSVKIDVQTVGLAERLLPDVETAVFRIVQEALTNVLKHASARTASVILEHQGDRLHVVIEDDGGGFDVDELAKDRTERESGDTRHRLGIFTIRERLALLGGSLRIEAAPGAGTGLFIDVPLVFEVQAS